ncbi:transcriptional regulatory protein FixJ [Sphingomonas metalli]|uniref:Transcriptional regulatory protein FixJ n=1 Tax=Sphingomonas metalli TaxID=1779358 RepID=A0A916WWY8_9SPHN|nr:response regulator [Sphingomonas metalli]GGB40444.1 transcriptional regulatory protein FixJ [Sphingomonas metalli]
MSDAGWVYIVDDDDDLRYSLEDLIETRGDWHTRSFPSGEAWLAYAPRGKPGCVILDLHLPGANGLDVLRRMVQARTVHQVIVLTGEGNVSAAVAAMQAGALNFLEKPVGWPELSAALRSGFHHLRNAEEAQRREADALERIARLSPREREVLLGMVEGLPNKVIAHRLDLSPRTVEAHRATMMEKLGVTNLADVVKCAFVAGLIDPAGAVAKPHP